MIEIKEGWTGSEALDQYNIKRLDSEISNLNHELELALIKRAEIQSRCYHAHVADSKCEICGADVK